MTLSQRAVSWLLMLACVVTVSAAWVAAIQGNVEMRQAALAGFEQGVADYVALHRRLEGPVPTNKVSDDLDQIRAAMDALAAKIQRERSGARRGEIFTTEASAAIRGLIRDACDGDFRRLLEIVQEEVEPGVGMPRVHDRWPAGVAHAMVPPSVLRRLPALPGELEYAFIGPHMLLWDVHADLIVDVLPNAIPTT
jgi:hypothetical protein